MRHQRRDSKSEKIRLESLPLSGGSFLSVLGLVLVVFALVIIVEKQLPPGLKIAEEKKFPDRFIAERAYNHLRKLTSFGPRVAGSYENEVLAADYLKTEIKKIIGGAKDKHVMELDVQMANGSFQLEFLDNMNLVYREQQNVVVKVGSKINSPHSLLINCHYDSVADSPGASDDLAGCAVMLEMLRVISQSDKTLRHNIIFLFNGGEENFLPASHGFITQHKWAKEIRAFINLEACGAGGREILFQAGPNHPWILETYSEEVPYPYASSLAQEIFQSGVIPGDTDYRIFRDFGNISGLDFAWSSNGYVYHTKFDTIDQIPMGSLQRTGDNILALARGMAQGHQLSNVEEHRAGNLVFFDFLGAFVVRWPMAISDVINIFTVLISLFTIHLNSKDAKKVIEAKRYKKKIFLNIIGIVATWISAIVLCLLIAKGLNEVGRNMSWFARPQWILFLYVIPTLTVAMAVILIHAKIFHKDIDVFPWTTFQSYYDSYQLLWTVVLIAGIFLRIRSSFIPLLWVVFPAMGTILRVKVFPKLKDERWLFLHIGVMGLPFVQCFYLMIGALYLFIPIMGRIGAGNNSEMLIAGMTSILFVLLFSCVTPLSLLVQQIAKIFKLLIGIFLISIALILLTHLGFPYSGEPTSLAPQRFMMSQTQRTFHDASGAVTRNESGFWIIDLDINSPHSVDKYVPEMRTATPVEQDCIDHLFCGVPYLVPVLNLIWKTHWIHGPSPPLEVPVTMEVLRRQRDKDRNRETVTIKVEGFSQMAVMVSPKLGVKLEDWDIGSKPLLVNGPWNGRDTYFIYYCSGQKPLPLTINMQFKVPDGHEGPIMDLAVTSHFMFGKSRRSKDLEAFVAKFPPWTAVNAWTATYESWIL